jgi:hypothetical protein
VSHLDNLFRLAEELCDQLKADIAEQTLEARLLREVRFCREHRAANNFLPHIREAARNGVGLDGSDAQELEVAFAFVEADNDRLLAIIERMTRKGAP